MIFGRSTIRVLSSAAGAFFLCLIAAARADDAELAKKLSNPVAALISVPIQMNYDTGYGPNDGTKVYANVQPVMPFSISEDWNLISRTILPIAWQDDIAGSSGEQFGLGDITQSLFFSPKAPSAGGVIWGVGPVFLIPTGTDDLLGTEKWGAGPTGLVLRQHGPWTYGILANHIWSFAGKSSRADVNSTFLQPFLSYTTPEAWTFGGNIESTYDWTGEEWSVPINVFVSKIVKFGGQPVSLSGGVRYWADSPPGGPEGLGFRFVVTFLLPK